MSDLPELLFSWEKHLRAEGKSKATVKAYGDGVRSYVRCSEHAGVSGLAKEDVVAFLAHPIDSGSGARTARRPAEAPAGRHPVAGADLRVRPGTPYSYGESQVVAARHGLVSVRRAA